ncbi:ADP-ribosyltransferase [Bacillus mycoides]|uniref:ADP-ribosyltransferase n=1 Tax=Bacillus mycoides TaxID=1405 RepID=UPI003804D4BA
MDRAFSRARLHNDMIVYSRVSESAFELVPGSLVNEDLMINMEELAAFTQMFQEKYKKDAAEGFSFLPILMRTHVPKGVPAIYVDPLSTVPGEMEFLLSRNRAYKVAHI